MRIRLLCSGDGEWRRAGHSVGRTQRCAELVGEVQVAEISVITPSYNHGRYLKDAVTSVLAQTYKDWEAIIVDDGSTDNTREVAAQFTDPRVRYIYQDNRGLPGARNAGIRIAHGRYLAFLDADDEWDPRFLEVCRSTLAARETVVAVVTLNRFIDKSGTLLPQLGGHSVKPERFRSRLIEGGFFPANAVLVLAEVVHRVGLFDESLNSVEDWDLWLRVAANGGTVLCIAQPLARYRVYPGSMSTNAQRMHTNRIAVLTKHYGPPEGDPQVWSGEKLRAYAFAYRATALGYIAQQEIDEGWHHLRQAVEIEPGLLRRLDTVYELALGDQPRGYRGDPTRLDVTSNGIEMLRRLDALFAAAKLKTRALRGVAYGNAYLALAMLNDQAGHWGAARRNMLCAVRAHPGLLCHPSIVRRFAKLLIGKSAVGWLRSLLLRTPRPSLTEGEV